MAERIGRMNEYISGCNELKLKLKTRKRKYIKANHWIQIVIIIKSIYYCNFCLEF